MRSIPAVIWRIYINKFTRHYLSQKKLFLNFLLNFLKCAWNLEHFQKKDEYPSLIISEIIEAERRSYLNV